jgi:internalin A
MIDGCKDVSDLAPLADLKGLKELTADGAENVADLTPLAGLTEMEKLVLSKTAIDSIAALKGMTKLQKLDVHSTKVADLSPLAPLTKLQYLVISNVPAKDYTALQQLTQLKDLGMSHSALTSTYLLGGMKDMKRLNLSNSTDLKDISSLKSMSGLEQLRIDDCPIPNLAPVPAMLDLQVLSAAGTKITSIQQLSNLTELRSVDLQRTAVMDFDPLVASARSLHYLGLPKGTTSDQYQSVTEANHKLHPDVSRRR